MATRFYLSASQPPGGGITPGFAAWTRTTEGDRRAMTVAKDGTTIAGKTAWAGTSPAANASALFRQYISPPMAGGVGFVTTDTIKGVIQCIESAANDNINRQPICLKVYAADGTTLQATLFALAHAGPATTEWVVTPTYTNRRIADGDVLATNYTTTAGDRLVLEIGGQISGSAGTSVTGTIKFGSNNASDLAENETDTTEANPWFEISRDITFLAPADNGDEAPWFTVRTMAQAASMAFAASLFTAQVALAAGCGWLPDEASIILSAGNQSVTPSPMPLVVQEQAPVVPVPWYWHQDELYVPPLRGEDDPPPSPAPAPWRYQALDPWGYDQPDRLPVLDGDGYAPPVVAGWPWQQGITGGGLPRIDGPAAPSLSVDEGTWPVPVVVPWAALTYQPGDQDEYPTPPPPVLPGEDEPYLPRAVVPWAVASYLPLDQGEHALLHAEDDPYLPPGMPLALPIGLPAWLGADEEILPVAAGLAGDEGAVLFGVQVGGWELVPPPAGGFGPPYVAAGLGIEEEPHLYWLVPQPPFSDPAFFVYEGEELAQPLDEDGYQPGVPVWGWQKPVFAVWALDEYPSGATPSIFGSDDAFQPPAPRAGWLAAPLALWAPDEVVPTLGVEHDPYVVPLPPLARPVGMPLGLGADDVAPVQPFGLHDDPDLRALFPLAPWYATVLPLGYDQGDGKPTATTHALASVLNWTDAVLSGYIHAVPVVLPRPPKGRGGKFGPLVAPPARVFYSAKAEREWRRAVEQKVFELRQQAGPGTAHEATDYALSSGWGATGSVSAVAATDVGGRVTIACAGAGVGANPTVTLTFRDGAFQVAPAVSCSRGDANAPTTAYWSTTTPGTSTVLFTFVGTPVAGTSYILDFTVVSRDPA